MNESVERCGILMTSGYFQILTAKIANLAQKIRIKNEWQFSEVTCLFIEVPKTLSVVNEL